MKYLSLSWYSFPATAFTFRYNDDVLLLNNPYFSQYFHLIYPSEFEIEDITDTRRTALYIDFVSTIDTDGRLYANIYYKHDYNNFTIIRSNTPSGKIQNDAMYILWAPSCIEWSVRCVCISFVNRICMISIDLWVFLPAFDCCFHFPDHALSNGYSWYHSIETYMRLTMSCLIDLEKLCHTLHICFQLLESKLVMLLRLETI